MDKKTYCIYWGEITEGECFYIATTAEREVVDAFVKCAGELSNTSLYAEYAEGDIITRLLDGEGIPYRLINKFDIEFIKL